MNFWTLLKSVLLVSLSCKQNLFIQFSTIFKLSFYAGWSMQAKLKGAILRFIFIGVKSHSLLTEWQWRVVFAWTMSFGSASHSLIQTVLASNIYRSKNETLRQMWGRVSVDVTYRMLCSDSPSHCTRLVPFRGNVVLIWEKNRKGVSPIGRHRHTGILTPNFKRQHSHYYHYYNHNHHHHY